MNYGRFVRRRLMTLGVDPTIARSIGARFQNLVLTRGPVGAVDYLKRVGDTILWYLYATPEKPSWVKTRNRFPVFLEGLAGAEEALLLRVARFSRAIRLDNPTSSQIRKVRDAVVGTFNGTEQAVAEIGNLIRVGILSYHLASLPKEDLGLPSVIGTQFHSVVSSSGKVPLTHTPPLAESLDLVAKLDWLQGVPNWEHAFAPLGKGAVHAYIQGIRSSPDSYVGSIYANQEGGAKLRMFAAPYTVVQAILRPIHSWIDRYRKLIPTDCTYDQLKGAKFAQSKLADGCMVHSVDLSTATCRFPLKPQVQMLDTLGLPEPALFALVKVCKGRWKVSSELRPYMKRNELRWNVGQPLGICPSMSMFSLAHNLLLTGLCVKWGLDPMETFRVLGDDVVIAHDLVHRDYISVVTEAGIPISVSKSHSSELYAEFAGCSISATAIQRGGQWKPLHFENALALAEDLGQPVDEGTEMLLLAQKVHLFSKGVYSPDVDEWSSYIKWCTMTSSDRYSIEDVVPDAPLSKVVLSKMYRELMETRFPGYDVTYLVDQDSLPDYAAQLKSMIPKVPGQISPAWHLKSTATWCYSQIRKLITSGYWDLERGVLALQQADSILRQSLWLPPSKGFNSASRARKLISAVLA